MLRISPVTEKLQSLCTQKIYTCLLGDFKGYKKASIDYAKLAVDNFDEAIKIKSPRIELGLFSKLGLKAAKVWFLNKFRIKTPEEKMLKRMAEEYKIRQQVTDLMNNQRHLY